MVVVVSDLEVLRKQWVWTNKNVVVATAAVMEIILPSK